MSNHFIFAVKKSLHIEISQSKIEFDKMQRESHERKSKIMRELNKHKVTLPKTLTDKHWCV